MFQQGLFREKVDVRKAMNRQTSARYRLHINSAKELKNPVRFAPFYTGGPLPPPREEPFFSIFNPNVFNVTKKELYYITLIQKTFRAHRMQRKMREEKHQRERDKEYMYRFKLDAIKSSTGPGDLALVNTDKTIAGLQVARSQNDGAAAAGQQQHHHH